MGPNKNPTSGRKTHQDWSVSQDLQVTDFDGEGAAKAGRPKAKARIWHVDDRSSETNMEEVPSHLMTELESNQTGGKK